MTWGFTIIWFQSSQPSPGGGNARAEQESPGGVMHQFLLLQGWEPNWLLMLGPFSGVWLICSVAFVVLGRNSAWSWVELQAQTLINTGTPREPLGVVQTQPRWEPKGFLLQGWCPVLNGTGKQIPEAIPDLCSVQKVQSLRNCIRKCPLCQHDKAKEPHKDWELLLVATPGKKKIKPFYPRDGEKPLKVIRNHEQSNIRPLFVYNSAFL